MDSTDVLGVKFSLSKTEATKRAILELIAVELVAKVAKECQIGILRGYGRSNAISALGICIRRGCDSWSPDGGSSLETWLVLLTSQECSKWVERKDKDKDEATASNQMNQFNDDGSEIDRFDEAARCDLDPFALDSVIDQCDSQEDATGMLMQAYALCYRDGVTTEIANLSARSGLSFSRISKICQSGELERRIRLISVG